MKVSFKSSALACALALVCGVASFSANTVAQDRSKLVAVIAPTVEEAQAQFAAWQVASAPKIAARTEIIGRVLGTISADAVRLNPSAPSETLRNIGQMLHMADMETLQQAAALTNLQDVEKFLVMARRQDAALPASNERRKAALGDGINLVFTPIPPCRIADSRNSVDGILIANTPRNYLNYGVSGQGGDAPCNNTFGIPGMLNGSTGALALTLTVANTTSGGWLQVAPIGTSFTTSVLNWTAPGAVVANSTVLKTSGGGADFRAVVSGGGNAHLIIDLLGFYLPNEPAQLQCQVATGPASSVAANTYTFLNNVTCAAGFSATGGGFSAGSNVLMADNGPSGTNGWYFWVRNVGTTTQTVTPQVQCCRVAGSITSRF